MQLSDVLIKAALWTHNTSINKIGYLPLQLTTGKAVKIPRLTSGNEATENMTFAKAVKKIMKTLTKSIA